MKIQRISIKNYRGIRLMDIPLGGKSAVIAGDNGAGKTSIIRAIDAGLRAVGVKPADIFVGEEASEIVIDLDAIRVVRAINQKGTTVNAKTTLGERVTQAQLAEMFGGEDSVDPLSFYLGKPEQRRAIVMAAMPSTVTMDDLALWTKTKPEEWAKEDLSGNGFDVVQRIGDRFYALRTLANKTAKDAVGKVLDASKTFEALAPALADLDEAAARATLAAREKDAATLRQRCETEERQTKAAADTRARAAEQRAAADKLLAEAAPAPTTAEEADVTRRLNHVADEIARVEAELEELRAVREKVAVERRLLDTKKKQRADLDAEVARLRQRANDMESAIPVVDVVEPAALDAADAAVVAAGDALKAATAAAAARAANEELQRCHAAAAETRMAADRLDDIVTALTKTAVAELAKRTRSIPGFDPAAMTLDGVPLDTLSGAEAMKFSVDLARRLRGSTEAKIMIIDGLERVSGKNRATFLAHATSDGWQVIATRVTDTELVLEAISS